MANDEDLHEAVIRSLVFDETDPAKPGVSRFGLPGLS
jgi:hypothetical protein